MNKTLRTNLIALLLGVVIFAGLLWRISAGSVVDHLSRAGPWIVAVILGYGLVQLVFVLAWRVLLVDPSRRVGLWELYRVYLAGDAVNYVVASGNLAGEPLKAHLLKDRIPMVRGLSSVTINKLSEAASMILFQAVGIGLAFGCHLMTPEMAWGSLLVFSMMTAGILLFFWRQKKGMFGWLLRGVSRLGIARSHLLKAAEKARDLDETISGFYEGGGMRFLASLGLNFLGWLGGAVEAYVLLRLLGVEATLPMVWAIEALSVLANNLFFFVPARLGGSDGGKVLTFVSMGMSSALGLSFGLLRRAREVFYVALGLAFLAHINPFRKREPLDEAAPLGDDPEQQKLVARVAA